MPTAGGSRLCRIALASMLTAGAVAWLPRPVDASVLTRRCGVAKLSALVRAVSAATSCRVPDFAGTSTYFACIDPPRTRTDAAFTRAEARGGCLPSVAGITAFAEVDSHTRAVADALGATPDRSSRRCAAKKLRAAAKKLGKKLHCHVTALRAGTAVDSTCLAGAEARFSAAIAAAESGGGCTITGDAAAIEARVDQTLAQLLSEVPARECEDAGNAPACGGPCAGSDVCIPVAGDFCICAPATCVDGPAPSCGGTCPGGGVCQPDIATSFSTCHCLLPTQPCGETYPVCNGTCPTGTTCGPEAGGLGGNCGCVPIGSTPCANAAVPVCGGGCSNATAICADVNSQVGAFFSYSGCACGPSTPCASGGIACPPGQRCNIFVTPFLSQRYCGSASGAFL